MIWPASRWVRLIDGSAVRTGDVVLGLASSGPHSNGYSLIRRVIERAGADLGQSLGGDTLGNTALAPTRIYATVVQSILEAAHIHAMAHITGGGLTENILRVVPDGLGLEIDSSQWPCPAIFDWLADTGNITPEEMRRTFNMGIGFVLICDPAQAQRIRAEIEEPIYDIGRVVDANGGDSRIRFLP